MTIVTRSTSTRVITRNVQVRIAINGGVRVRSIPLRVTVKTTRIKVR